MKCKLTQILLADYSAQRLPLSEAESVRLHLAECPACARMLREEAILAGGLEQVPFIEPAGSSKMWQAVSAGLEMPEASLKSRWFAWVWPPRPAASLAALATTAAAMAGLYAYVSQPVPTPNTQVADMPRILTIARDVNPVVDDPLADRTDDLFAAVDQMTQRGNTRTVQ